MRISHFPMVSARCNGLKRALALAGLTLIAPVATYAASYGKGFATPEEAVAALASAVRTGDTNALHVIFGPSAADLENPDRVQAATELENFTAAFRQGRRIVRDSDTHCTLEVGETLWPFPVPIIKQQNQWFFDTDAGKEELLNRRIGRNELATLQAVRAYVAAQREYAEEDRDGDDVLEYAQTFLSSPGQKNGLYWPSETGSEISPLGPLVADAQAEGYARKSKSPTEARSPFHGYYFKILTAQGKHAPGGAYSYIINGNMIAGFALVAWPASYGETGIMTFIVNQRGRVYQKDLGPNSDKAAEKIDTYDPDDTWHLSPD